MLPDPLGQILGHRIREVAAARDIPLSLLADKAKIARSHLWEIVAPRPRRSATLRLVQRLAEVLGCDPIDLLQESPLTTAPSTATSAANGRRR